MLAIRVAPVFLLLLTVPSCAKRAHNVEVIDDPALIVDGGEPQLDAAIKQMLSELKRNGYAPPQRPAYPDRSGMGIRERDK